MGGAMAASKNGTRTGNPAHWNYRLIRDDEGYLGIHEVYYDDDGNVVNWTGEVSLWAETVEDLRKQFEDALSKPILIREVDGEQTLVPEIERKADA